MRRTLSLTLLLTTTALYLVGCGSMLPHGQDKVISPWKSFDEVMAAYDKVIPQHTERPALIELGFSPERSPNVRILNHLEILNRLAPHQALSREDLPSALLQCVKAHESCQAYEVKLQVTEHKRYGNFLADFFSFRRKTQIRGWAFNAVFVLNDDLVVYKVWSGTPNIDEYRDINNPLGPLQGIGSDVVKPDIGY